MISSILSFLNSILGSYPFLFVVTSIALALKGYILFTLATRSPQTSSAKACLYLSLVLIGSMFSDSVWILTFVQSMWIPTLDYRIRIFWIRIAWAFFIIQYQALALFIESLVDQEHRLNVRQKLFIFISSLFCLFFIGLAFIHINCIQASERSQLEIIAIPAAVFYCVLFLIPSTILATASKLRTTTVPRILKKQLTLFIQALIIPLLLSDFLQTYPFSFLPTFIAGNFAFIGIQTLLLTFAIYYCTRKVIALRFLNFKSHVQSQTKYNFIDNFKEILEQLSFATSPQELAHITQTYFNDAFAIPLRRTTLYLRKLDSAKETETVAHGDAIKNQVEAFLSTSNVATLELMQETKVLIYDEIAFNNFYENNVFGNSLLAFLQAINADIFIPICQDQKIIAYIIVERNARPQQFYSNMERDEMLVFASYLGNIIHLLQNRNLELLIHREKELKEELYNKHQEINQYKESIRSFLRNTAQKKIGIIFYKNRRFIFGNQSAKELIKINVNVQEGHPLTQALKKIARQVEEFSTPQTTFANDADGNKLVLSAVPNLEKNNVIITAYYPEVSDIITKQLDQLKDPTKWDYLLYLETTQSGQLINQLIPGSGETLLNIKIELLKTALSKKAMLLEMPEEDLLPTVELLHHISLREQLHVLTLQGPEKNFDTAIKLFGINQLFGIAQPEEPLLKKLHNTGTLFIQNINFLSLDTQEYLAESIRYDFYRVFKSDQKVQCNVRIICSSSQDLTALAQQGKFSQALSNELKKTTLSMPSLHTLPEQELNNLVEGLTEQAIKTKTFKNLWELTDREKHRLANQKPVSLQELKTKVQQLLIQKSKKHEIAQETQFDPAYEISDPELVQAARLGKHALKDPRTMGLLWSKFKSQNKIATFLGVNRSSVNRRCKKYNLV